MKERFRGRQLVIMALGNIIGSGIFLGSSTVISVAGPSAVLAYLLGGVLMALEVTFITEMCVVNPAPGAFRVHASEIFGPWIGFVNGWLFWLSGVLGMAGEVSAAAIFSRWWLPHVPLWAFCVFYSALMTVINLCDLRGLSRAEGALSSVKVAALAVFLLFGLLVLTGAVHLGATPTGAASAGARPQNPFSSLHALFPKGAAGFFASLVMVMFSFTGTGIIGMALADTENPAKSAPPAIAAIIGTVITAFTLSAALLVTLAPWNVYSPSASPFVQLLGLLGIPFSGGALNFIVLTASLSGLNSSMYSSSRMLASLSRDNQAPALFGRESKNGTPVPALLLSSAALALAAVLSYLLPQSVFVILASASGFLAILNWMTISFTHLFYRRKTLREHPERLKFRAPGYPFTGVLELALLAGVLATSPCYPGQASGLVGSLALFALLAGLYFALRRKGRLR